MRDQSNAFIHVALQLNPRDADISFVSGLTKLCYRGPRVFFGLGTGSDPAAVLIKPKCTQTVRSMKKDQMRFSRYK